MPAELPGRAEESRTVLTKTPRTCPLRMMPARLRPPGGSWGRGTSGGTQGGRAWQQHPGPQPLCPAAAARALPLPRGPELPAHASQRADTAASIFTTAEPGLAPFCSSAQGLAWAGPQETVGKSQTLRPWLRWHRPAQLTRMVAAGLKGGPPPPPPSPCERTLPQILTQHSAEMSFHGRRSCLDIPLRDLGQLCGAPALPCPKQDTRDTRAWTTGSPHHYSPVFSVVSLHLLSRVEPSRMWRLEDVGPPTLGRKTSRDPTSHREVSRIGG